MKTVRFLIYTIIFFCFAFELHAQSWEFSGFVSEMPSYSWQKNNHAYFDNLIHNRLNIQHQLNKNLLLNIEFRNRWYWGESIRNDATQKYIIDSDPGAIDLSFNIGTSNSYVINSKIDRLSLIYNKGCFNLKVGRQRVDWGLSKIWNANDIFNTYSFYDFDYEAKPGMDGVSMGFSLSDNKQIETVLKVNSNQKLSFASMFKTNINNFTLHLMAGEINQEDYVLGLGWKYRNNKTEVYSETSYFKSQDNKLKDNCIITAGLSYYFNKITLSAEYLYSDYIEEERGDVNALMNRGVSLKNLSIADHTYNFSLQYSFSKIVKSSIDLIGFGYPVFDGIYLGSTTHIDLNNDLTLSGIVQGFHQSWLPEKKSSLYFYLRLKKNF